MPDRKVAKDSASAQLTDLVSRLNNVITSYTNLQAVLVKGDDTSPLVKLIRAEKLKSALGTAGYTLQVKVAAAGGAMQVKRNLLYSKISYSGGAVATWILFNADGTVRAGGVVRDYTGQVAVGLQEEDQRNLRGFLHFDKLP